MEKSCKSCKYSKAIAKDLTIALKEASITISNELICKKLLGFTAEDKPYGGTYVAGAKYNSKHVLVKPEFYCAYFEPTILGRLLK